MIPIAEGRRLYDAAREPKQFVEIAGGHIRPAEEDADKMFNSVRAFLQQAKLLGQR